MHALDPYTGVGAPSHSALSAETADAAT